MGRTVQGSEGSLQPKAVYEPVAKLEAFYTGGAVRVTRDNRHMACACGDEVKVLDVATGTVARTLPGDSEPITSLALSPDKHSLVAASRSLTVRHWDWTSGECRRTWKPHRAPVADMAVDASGGFVATGSADRSVKVTDLAGGFVTHHFTGHSGIVLRVLFHPRQLMLFSSDDQGEVRIWDLVTKAPAFKTMTKGHLSAVPALCLAPDGWHLLSGGRDKVVCVWDIRNGSKVATLPVYEALEGLAVLPVGSAFPGVLPTPALLQQGLSGKTHFFATAGERGVVRIWRSDTGACLYTYSGSSSSSAGGFGGSSGSSGSEKKKRKKQATALGASEVVSAAAGSELLELLLLPGGKGLLAATGDARLLFFHPQVEAGASTSSELSLTRQLVGNLDEVTDLAFVYNTAASGSNDSDEAAAAAEGGSSSSSSGLQLLAHEPRRVAVATNSHDVRLFELSDASCVGACVGHRDIVLCLSTVRPMPGVELLASGAKDNEVRVWDTASGTCLAVAAGHVGAVTAVAWSTSKAKGGRYLASGGEDKLLKLWDTSALLESNAKRQSGPVALSTVAAVAAHDKAVNAIALSPNDSLLATAGQDKVIKLWRLPSLVLAATLRGHKRGVWDIAFSPTEQVLLSCSGDKLLKLWSVVDGTCLRTFEGHTGAVLRCSFLTAGTQVLSAGADGLLKLWDTRTGANLATFESHDDRLWGLAVSQGPAESLLASGGADARIVVWRDVTASRAAAAEAEEEQLVARQQELSNALADGDYAAAARLAFQLRHPGRLLEVLRSQPSGPTAVLSSLQALVGDLSTEELATALSYCREWNTNTRNAHLAQVLLRAILSRHTPQQILAVPGAGEIVRGLLAYSQRHATRLDRLLRSTFLLDYTLAASQVLLPADAHDALTDVAAADAAAAAAATAATAAGNGHVGAAGGQQHGGPNGLPAANGRIGGGGSSSSDGGGSSDDGSSSDEEAAAAGQQQKQQQQHQAAADSDADRPDPQLPGWGGGDDLSDDWEGPGVDVQDDTHDIVGSDDGVMGSGEDVMVDAEGVGSDGGVEGEEGSGSDGDSSGSDGDSSGSDDDGGDSSDEGEGEGEDAGSLPPAAAAAASDSVSEGDEAGAVSDDQEEEAAEEQQQQRQLRGGSLRQNQQQQQQQLQQQQQETRQLRSADRQLKQQLPKQQQQQRRQPDTRGAAKGKAAAAAGAEAAAAAGVRASGRRAGGRSMPSSNDGQKPRTRRLKA